MYHIQSDGGDLLVKQLLCYGDSNTWGLIAGTEQRYPWGVRWTSILQDKLYKKNVRVLEEGLCGRTTVYDDFYRENRNGLKTLSLVLETHSPVDYAVIMLGTNDCKSVYNLTPRQVAQGMEQCINLLLKYIPAESILLVSPIHLGDKVWKTGFDPEFNQKSVEVSKKLQSEYKKLADKKKIRMIAASDYALASETDQEHLTEEGHNVLAQAVYRELSAFI